MNQEDKELLLIVLSAMLPYKVVVNYDGLARPLFGIEPTQHFQITLDNALDGKHNGLVYVSLDVDGEYPKPYLRPMSSMTEKEFKEWLEYSKADYDCEFKPEPTFSLNGCHLSVDWLNAHHLDYRGLIGKGLALEAPNYMYKKI